MRSLRLWLLRRKRRRIHRERADRKARELTQWYDDYFSAKIMESCRREWERGFTENFRAYIDEECPEKRDALLRANAGMCLELLR